MRGFPRPRVEEQKFNVVAIQSLSRVQLFLTPWTPVFFVLLCSSLFFFVLHLLDFAQIHVH